MMLTEGSEALLRVSQDLSRRGWLRATSGNLSVRPEDSSGAIVITRSGVDKQKLTPKDLILVSPEGQVLHGEGRPSFETAIHWALYRQNPDARAVFHVHTIYNNLVTAFQEDEHVVLRGSEMIKALGLWAEDAALKIPVVPNHQDIDRVAREVTSCLRREVPGILLERHGIYVHGRTPEEALKHLEAFEFLFEWHYLSQSATTPRPVLSQAGARPE